MPRFLSAVIGFALPSLPYGASQTFRKPSRGARNEMYLPSGLSRACVRTGLPNSAARGMRVGSADSAAPDAPEVSVIAAITPQIHFMSFGYSYRKHVTTSRTTGSFEPSSVQEHAPALVGPRLLIGHGQRIEVAGLRVGIVDPLAQQL